MEAVREAVGKLQFGAVWTLVGLAALIVLAAVFWPALLGLGFVAVLLFALWRTRERVGWAQALAALGLLTIFALIFWRSWLIIAMVVAIAALALRAIRVSRPAES